ncbi:uncharacterized protein LOC129720267 [Wyeomyia smithii]|uniref:uncharacterized protein LOC129720267 n=1 Tax=Wyeomyia smithii TaxID=174621 RepID=UPI002467F6DF|nr:uncharacterized protein LOC129720267 [Wyeomyia smithii]
MPLEHSPVRNMLENQNQVDQLQEGQNVPFLSRSRNSNTPTGQHSRSNSSASFHGFNWEEGMELESMRKLKGLFRQRGQIEQKLVRIQLTLQTQSSMTLAQLQCAEKKLVVIYSEFSHFHSEIMALIPDEASDEQDEIYCTFEDRHTELSNHIQERINAATQMQTVRSSVSPQVIIQQQPLKAPIPTFDGNYANWPKFKAIFQDLMAQSRDSESLKLYHLDKALIGSAAGILDAKIINEGNYKQAWKVLTDRYENTRVIVESHIQGLLTLRKMSQATFKELDGLLTEATGHVEGLRYQKQQLTGISEHIVVHLIVSALDNSTRMAWERIQQRGVLPKYEQTISFLKTSCQVLEQCESSQAFSQRTAVKSKFPPVNNKMPSLKTNAVTSSSSKSSGSCHFCGGSHLNFQCEEFKQLTATQRAEKVRAKGLCFNCLRKGHQSKQCTSNNTCRKCSRKHHTILHDDAERNSSQDSKAGIAAPKQPVANNQPTVVQPSVSVVDKPVSTTCSSNHVSTSKTVLLLTAVVQAIDEHNQSHPCRVLLDSGSQVNFVTEKMATRLGCSRMPANVSITGINALRSLARDKVFVKFQSSYGDFQANIECLVTTKVTGTIPNRTIDFSSWELPEGIQLADPHFFQPEKVDMLIGGELFFDLLKPDQISLGDNLPQLRETHLGWVVAGVINEPYISNAAIQHVNHASIDSIEEMMHQFWKVEEVPNASPFSSEQLSCEAHFLSTYKRDATGRFVVKLPFKENLNRLDNCRSLALKRFLMLEKRLERNPELRQQYNDFIREYEDLGHCREVKEAEDPGNMDTYYLPHHAVLRPSSSTTKCRVVFDASAKMDPSKLSLNEVLQVGPVVQNGIFSITLRFRKYAYAFSSVIEKMYRQVFVAPEERRFLRCFWRSDPSHPLRVLELNTVTYGTACAPYQATRCLVQLAKEEGSEFPIGSRILTEDFYVDDALSGANTLEEALESQRQLKELLTRGGFHIHKWCSNSAEFLEHIPPADRERKVPFHEYGANEVIKVLGLLWDPDGDVLMIANPPKCSFPDDELATKRMIYSEVAKLFDPLGLFAPVIVMAKLLVQQLWKISAGWDDPIDETIRENWATLRASLPDLGRIHVPRCVMFPNAIAYELHGFSDASNVAYGACVYLRSIFTNGSANLRLLCSKSKVAPLDDVSIPRKELCAAQLLSKLISQVVPALRMNFREVVLWSDSTIVLAWLKKPLDQLQTFVRNRIALIRKDTNEYRWSYVCSANNPADIVSRGKLPEDLKQNILWWSGPRFLCEVEYDVEDTEEILENLPELKVHVITMSAHDSFPFFGKFSSFRKIQRTMCYVLRFIRNCKRPKSNRVKQVHLSIEELRQASEAIVKAIQQAHLGDEIKRVISNQTCKRLGNLRPVYENGLLRVGGRLDRSVLPFAAKHQLILPDKDPVTKKLIRTLHMEHLHVGQAGLISIIRQRYWLLNAKSTVRQVTRSCVTCFRTKPVETKQLMGNLPTSRIVPSPPFAVTGVDYAGPFMVRQGSYRPKLVKSYVAVYVCMATKAVHLEIVSDLTTDAFLASLKRFISRRGMVQQIHSDNATNFHGASNQLHELYRQFQNQQEVKKIQQFCEVREIQWHFIPPDAPEFGGLWEAAVKAMKTHLKRVVGNANLTYEEMATILAEIEAILNSRPLFSLSNDPADPQVITPAHYLIGRPLSAPAEPSLEDTKVNRLDRWQHLQLMREHFWRAWSRDYLNSLQPRKKNTRATSNVRPGMVVLLHDKTQPPLSWKLGRITGVYPGDDGLVRAIDVFSNGATYRRPINKVSIIPIEDNVCSAPVLC